MNTKTKLIDSCISLLLMASCHQNNELPKATGNAPVGQENFGAWRRGLGHILGAKHIGWGFSHRLGGRLYLGYDLIISTHNWLEKSKHFNKENRNKIYNNLH